MPTLPKTINGTMKFVDRAKIFVKSGKGGKGCISFLREKFREFGGPDGGNGGDGGSVFCQGDLGMNTLYDVRLNPHIAAGNGLQGSGKNKTGKNGEDVVIHLPPGTVISDFQTGEILTEVVDSEPILLLKGGRGGKGNKHFHSAKRKTPYISQPGEEGVEKVLFLELKVIADIGLVGFPNAGKSTLIKSITNAEPKIADYPFTTLTPNMGVFVLDYKKYVLADIPGIIEGASQGVGLGLDFLRHIERTKVLAFLLDGSILEWPAILKSYETLEKELSLYEKDLSLKKKMVLLTKTDILGNPDHIPQFLNYFQAKKIPALAISCVSGHNLERLKIMLADLLM